MTWKSFDYDPPTEQGDVLTWSKASGFLVLEIVELQKAHGKSRIIEWRWGGGVQSYFKKLKTPTHWRPLPKPPTT